MHPAGYDDQPRDALVLLRCAEKNRKQPKGEQRAGQVVDLHPTPMLDCKTRKELNRRNVRRLMTIDGQFVIVRCHGGVQDEDIQLASLSLESVREGCRGGKTRQLERPGNNVIVPRFILDH